MFHRLSLTRTAAPLPSHHGKNASTLFFGNGIKMMIALHVKIAPVLALGVLLCQLHLSRKLLVSSIDTDYFPWINTEYSTWKPHKRVVFVTGIYANGDISYKQTSTNNKEVLNIATPKKYQSKSADYLPHTHFDEGCSTSHKWQEESHLVCNNVHELDMIPPGNRAEQSIHFVGKGARRIAWRIADSGDVTLALKTLVYDRSCHINRQYLTKREVQSLERMSTSKHATDVYGQCGCTGLHEFLYDAKSGGELLDSILQSRKDTGEDMRLRYAYQVTSAISDVHQTEADGVPALVYGHLQPMNILFVNGTCKLSDFEQGEILKYHREENRTCGFRRWTESKNRAPEEGTSKHPYREITDKSDVYRLGNIFKLLLGEEPALDDCDFKNNKVRKYYDKEGDHIAHILASAFKMTNACNPTKRTSAMHIRQFLKKHLDSYEHEQQKKLP